MKRTFKDFNGDAEKFYSSFYGHFVDNMIQKLEWTNTNLLLAEVANKILAYLSGNAAADPSTTSLPALKLSDKEVSALQYL